MFRQLRLLMIWMTAFMLCAQVVYPASLSACCCRMNSETGHTGRVCCLTSVAKPARKACCNLNTRQTEKVNSEFHAPGCSCGQSDSPALPDRSQHAQETLLLDLNLQLGSFMNSSQETKPSSQYDGVVISSHHSQKYAQVLYCVALI